MCVRVYVFVHVWMKCNPGISTIPRKKAEIVVKVAVKVKEVQLNLL